MLDDTYPLNDDPIFEVSPKSFLDLINFLHVEGKCCKICRETEGCGAWSWSTRTNNCYLKTPTGYRHQNMSWVRSGVVLNAKKGNSALVTSCSEDSEAVYWQPQLTVGDHALSKGFAKYLKTSHGSNNKFVIKDPTGSGSVPVIKTVYPAGCWSPSANCNGGALFYSFPEGKGKSIGDAVRLEYEVYFPKDFPWVKGGKLPGLNGGSTGCGGGANADKKKCMSGMIVTSPIHQLLLFFLICLNRHPKNNKEITIR